MSQATEVKEVRIESFLTGTTQTISLDEARETYGADELHEYLHGYNADAAFFLVIDGEDICYAEANDMEVVN